MLKFMCMFKKIFIVFATLLFIFNICPIYGEEEVYYVYDTNSENKKLFDNYEDALDYYDDNKPIFNNLVFASRDEILDMEYGIVSFNDEMFEYHSILRGEDDFLSGSYGKDGAFLKVADDKVYFAISGDIGYTDIKNVALIPYENIDVKTSSYIVKDDILYHNIKTQLDFEYYSICLPIDDKLDYLDNNIDYFSYDGHYFYNDFYSMIDDYRNDSYNNAINKDNPYYNYYQYLSHRSLTNYSIGELENYFYKILGIDGRLNSYRDFNHDNANDIVNRSQLYGNIDKFITYQDLYGTNGLMLLSSAVVESNYGKSLESYLNNNLYLNSACEYIEEKENNRYNSIERSIYAHAKYYISNLYSNNRRNDYHGTYYGNKLGGINIEYALDEYYGEKCASKYYEIDKALGYKDKDNYCIGLIIDSDKVNVYEDDDLEGILFYLQDVEELSFVILDENDEAYKIQIDNSFNNEYLYNFEECVGYIPKDNFNYLLNDDNYCEYEFIEVEYDFEDGEFLDRNKLSFWLRKGDDIPLLIPYKEGYEFVSYDSDNKAIYKQIDSISATNLFNKQKDIVPYPDLSEAVLNIKYVDGSSNSIDFNSDMISCYDLHNFDSQEVTYGYLGLEKNKDIQIDDSYYEITNKLINALDEENCSYIKTYLSNQYLDIDSIRNIDAILKENNKRNYVINNNIKDNIIGLSGLDLSLDDKDDFIYVNDTYYVNINEITNESKVKIDNIASGYNLNSVKGINISVKFNYQDIELNGPAVVSINVDDKDINNIYTVYHVDNKGDVIKCETRHTKNNVEFVIYESGDYEVLCMPSLNTFNIEDNIENLNYENMGVDIHKINIEFMIIIALCLIGIVGVTFYYIFNGVKEKQWSDYKKSLLKAGTVQEEKQKN